MLLNLFMLSEGSMLMISKTLLLRHFGTDQTFQILEPLFKLSETKKRRNLRRVGEARIRNLIMYLGKLMRIEVKKVFPDVK